MKNAGVAAGTFIISPKVFGLGKTASIRKKIELTPSDIEHQKLIDRANAAVTEVTDLPWMLELSAAPERETAELAPEFPPEEPEPVPEPPVAESDWEPVLAETPYEPEPAAPLPQP